MDHNTSSISPNEEKVLKRLKQIDPNKIPPLEALSILDELKRILKEKD